MEFVPMQKLSAKSCLQDSNKLLKNTANQIQVFKPVRFVEENWLNKFNFFYSKPAT